MKKVKSSRILEHQKRENIKGDTYEDVICDLLDIERIYTEEVK